MNKLGDFMKKHGFYCFCALAVIALVCFGLSGQYELIPGMFIVYAVIAFGFFAGDKSKKKNMPVWAACILLCAVGVWLLLSQRRRERRPDAQFADGQGGLT